MTKKKTDAEKEASKKESQGTKKRIGKPEHRNHAHEHIDGQAWERGESIELAKDTSGK